MPSRAKPAEPVEPVHETDLAAVEAENARRALDGYRQPDVTNEAAGPAEPNEEVRG